MKNLTTKAAKEHILNNYGYLKHDIKKLVQASRTTAKKYNCSPIDIFFFMIENKKVNGIFLFEYGFNNRLGREIKQTFKNNYYE